MRDDAAPVPRARVVVEGDRIAEVSPAAGPAPQGLRVDGRGKWLLPGFTDMHVHLPNDGFARMLPKPARAGFPRIDTQDQLTPFVANGVTQVFNLSALAESVGQATEVETGRALGPHIANAAMIDGVPPIWTGLARGVASPSDGRQAVRDAETEGYRFIKVYSRLDLATFLAVVEEARGRGMRVLGHIPDAVRGHTEAAFVPGYDLVVHAEEYAKQSPDLNDADIRRFADLARRNGTWLTPTLTTSQWVFLQTRSLDELRALPTLRYLHPMLAHSWLADNTYARRATPERLARFERIVDFDRRLARTFAEAGVPQMVATDAMNPGMVPGFSIHDELLAMAEAGLSNADVLAGATRLPAEWLGVERDRGTIEVGKRADLVLLDADPLADLRSTRAIHGVLLGGRWLPRAELDARLAALAERNAAVAASLPRPG
ncbi:MAG TPA: amidohydrolase family protein [Phenylobacterium sp.]